MSSDYGVLDIETYDEPWNGGLICVGWRDRAYTVDELDGEHAFVLSELADPSIAKVVFTKYDHRWLRLAGYDVRGPIADVQAMAWTVDENTDPLDLENVSHIYAKTAFKEKRIWRRGGMIVFKRDSGEVVPLVWALADEAIMGEVQTYNELDLLSTAQSYEALLRRLRFEGDGLDEYWANDVVPLTPVLVDMEVRGMPVNLEASRAMRERLEREIAESDAELRDEAGLPDDFNLNSNDQLAAYLYGRKFAFKRRLPITPEQRTALKADPTARVGLPAGFDVQHVGRLYVTGTQQYDGRGLRSHRTTGKGKRAVDSKTLRLHHGDDLWVQTYLDMAKRQTIVNTFLTTFEEVAHGGRIYGTFVQTGTVTGRLSSRSPNLQNIPSRGTLGREVRDLFVPTPGWVFVHGDYGQLEPRIMAHLSGDPVLTDIFVNGEDVYLRTAREVFGDPIEAHDPRRQMMKTYVLALSYGAGPEKLRETLALDGFLIPLHEVEDTYRHLERVYRVFFDWKEQAIRDAKLVGYADTLAGHRRHILFGRQARGSWRGGADAGREGRQAANAKVQGTAAEVVARTMVKLAAEFRGDPRLIAQVHDELLLEARRGVELRHPNLLARIERIATTEHGFDLKVPLVFEPRIIRSWGEGKD